MRQLVFVFVQVFVLVSYFIYSSVASRNSGEEHIVILGGEMGGMSPLVLAGGGGGGRDRKGGGGHIIILGGGGGGQQPFYGNSFGGFGSYPWLFGGQNGW